MAGITATRSGDMPHIKASRWIADSKLPVKRRAPVRNRFPTLAEEKSKVESGGLARFIISKLTWFSIDRNSSRASGEMGVQSEEVPATISCQSAYAGSRDFARR